MLRTIADALGKDYEKFCRAAGVLESSSHTQNQSLVEALRPFYPAQPTKRSSCSLEDVCNFEARTTSAVESHKKFPDRESQGRLASLVQDLMPALPASRGEGKRRLSVCLVQVEEILLPILRRFDKDLKHQHELAVKLQKDIETAQRHRHGVT